VVWGVVYQKQLLRLKLMGSGLGEHPEKFGTPYLFLHPLKLATSNLEHNLGLGSSLARNNTFTTEIG